MSAMFDRLGALQITQSWILSLLTVVPPLQIHDVTWPNSQW